MKPETDKLPDPSVEEQQRESTTDRALDTVETAFDTILTPIVGVCDVLAGIFD